MMNMVTWLIDCSWCPVRIEVQCMYPPLLPPPPHFNLGTICSACPCPYTAPQQCHMQPLPKVRCFQARVALEVISQNICPCLQEAFILRCHSGHIKKKIMLRMTFNMTFHYSIMYKKTISIPGFWQRWTSFSCPPPIKKKLKKKDKKTMQCNFV